MITAINLINLKKEKLFKNCQKMMYLDLKLFFLIKTIIIAIKAQIIQRFQLFTSKIF